MLIGQLEKHPTIPRKGYLLRRSQTWRDLHKWAIKTKKRIYRSTVAEYEDNFHYT